MNALVQENVLVNWNPLLENTMISGSAQVGKTTLARKLASMLKLKFNVIIFDPHGYGTQRGFTSVCPSCVKHHINEITGQGLEIIQPLEDSAEFFEKLCEKVYTLQNLVFMMDELHNYASNYHSAKSLDKLSRNCNNRNIGYIAIFQRPAEVPKYILSNATHRFLFYLDVPNDRKYIKDWVGVDGLEYLQQFEGFYHRQGSQAKRFKI